MLVFWFLKLEGGESVLPSFSLPIVYTSIHSDSMDSYTNTDTDINLVTKTTFSRAYRFCLHSCFIVVRIGIIILCMSFFFTSFFSFFVTWHSFLPVCPLPTVRYQL